MVARLISVSDDTELSDLHDVFQRVLAGPSTVKLLDLPGAATLRLDTNP